MTPREALDAGHLAQAIQLLTNEVKARPADASLRVFMFELLSFDGDFDRAAKQLEVVSGQGGTVGAELAIQVYRDLLTAERTRRAVFHGDALPKFLLAPPAYIDRYVMLVKKLQDAPKDAVALLPQAEEEYPAIAGRLGDGRFAAFRDADDRLAPVLEVFHGADYLWIPLEQITHLQIHEPKSLRDLIWARARIETYERSVGDVFVPALYVDTPSHGDDQVRLGRMTDWRAVEDQLVAGAGRRVFLADDREVSLMELRDLEFDAVGEKAVQV